MKTKALTIALLCVPALMPFGCAQSHRGTGALHPLTAASQPATSLVMHPRYRVLFGEYPPGSQERSVLLPLIRAAGVNAGRGLVDIRRGGWPEAKDRGRPTGIETISLSDGRLLRTTRVPEHLDLSGSDRSGQGVCFIDSRWRRAYLATALDERRVLLCMDLEKDDPRVLGAAMDIVMPPIANDTTLVFATTDFRQDMVALTYVDRATGRPLASYPLEKFLNVFPLCAANDMIVTCVDRNSRLQVWRVGKDGPQKVVERRLPANWSVLSACSDYKAQECIVTEVEGDSRKPTRRIVRRYSLMSLKEVSPVASLFAADRRRFMSLPNADMILAIPAEATDTFLYGDLHSGKLKGTASLNRNCSWVPCADDEGALIGAYSDGVGCDAAILLYAVPSEGVPGTSH